MDMEIEKNFKKIFLTVFQNIDSGNFDFGKDRSEFENWDSLTHMQLVSEIESAFNVSFEMDEIAVINKPQDFITLIQKKKNA